MRYKTFLMTEGRSETLHETEAIRLIKENCTVAVKSNLNNKGKIHRGVNNNESFLFVDPKSAKPRRSANTKNYYTLLMDNMKSWKKYPKRSESLICSTNQRQFGYGFHFVVLPYDNAVLGVASKQDLWVSFEDIDTRDLSQFNNNIGTIMRELDVSISDSSYLDVLNAFGEFDMSVSDNPEVIDNLINGGIKWLQGYKGDLLKHMQKLLDPNRNDFELKKIGDKLPKDREVWTDSKCIMVSDRVFDEFIYETLK